MTNNIKELMRTLRKRIKFEPVVNYMLYSIGLIFICGFSLLIGIYWLSNTFAVSVLFFLIFMWQGTIVFFLIQGRTCVWQKNLVIYPLSPFRFHVLLLSTTIHNKWVYYYATASIIICSFLMANGAAFPAFCFLIISLLAVLALQVWLFNISNFLSERLRSSPSLPFAVTLIFVIVLGMPNTIGKYFVFNYYPLTGWIGSTITAAQQGDYITVGFYVVLSILTLVIGLWVGQVLLRPGKKVRWI